MRKEFWNHGSTRMRGAFVRTGALRQFERGRALANAIREIRGLILSMVSAVVIFAVLAAEPTVSVTAQQRYPWNGMVDVAFTITGESGTKYDTSFVARDVAGGTNLTMKTIYKSDGSAAALTNRLAAGSYKWVWNAAADLPYGFNCERVVISGNVIKVLDINNATYMVIDLSAGSSATSYPITYMNAIPGGKWSDEYKTTKLVLRRIEPGSFKMQGLTTTTLTKPFYLGVFEVTQKQWLLVEGSNQKVYSYPSSYEIYTGDTYPACNSQYSTLRGSSEGAQWPSSANVDASSFIGLLRKRAGVKFDLPTEAQWEYACRAGTTTTYYWGSSANGDYAWTYSNAGGISQHAGSIQKVGEKKPNNWGLYDMSGNVWEVCLDWYGALTYGEDPVGPTSGAYRVQRGGSIGCGIDYCTSSYRWYDDGRSNEFYLTRGFRLCFTIQ